jgi:uncharacterized membrane protein
VKWALLAVIVASTTASDLLQSHGMRQGGRTWKLPLAIFFMALSFFAFTQVLKIADLSFVVPATASTIVIETLLAWLVLREPVGVRRWLGAALVACGVWLVAI